MVVTCLVELRLVGLVESGGEIESVVVRQEQADGIILTEENLLTILIILEGNFMRSDSRRSGFIGSPNCCLLCGHCDDEIIAEQMNCKCKCHTRGQ